MKDDIPTNDENSNDPKKDEEEEAKSTEPVDTQPSLKDRFKKLTEALKQKVINKTMDKVRIDKIGKNSFCYHGYTPAPPGPNATSSNNLQEVNSGNSK